MRAAEELTRARDLSVDEHAVCGGDPEWDLRHVEASEAFERWRDTEPPAQSDLLFRLSSINGQSRRGRHVDASSASRGTPIRLAPKSAASTTVRLRAGLG